MILMMLAAATLLTPSRPWEINYGVSQCRLSRTYGKESNVVMLSFADVLAGSMPMMLTLNVPNTSSQAREDGTALVSFGSNAGTQRREFFSTVSNDGGRRILQTTIAVPSEVKLESVSTLRINAGSVDVTLAPGISVGALKAFHACADDLRVRLHLSPDEASVMDEPAIGPAEDWISSDDYPKEALRNRNEGTVVTVLSVGMDGRVSNCQPVLSSGTPLLDATTCTLLARRGRFRPAFNKAGQPIASHFVWQTDWRLPKR